MSPEDDRAPEHRTPSNQHDDSPDAAPKVVEFEELAEVGDEVWIRCEGQIYRLRRTKQKKLILTK